MIRALLIGALLSACAEQKPANAPDDDPEPPSGPCGARSPGPEYRCLPECDRVNAKPAYHWMTPEEAEKRRICR